MTDRMWRPPLTHASCLVPDVPSLTREEIAELEDDAKVTIYWSGGNGPHQYLIRRWAPGESDLYAFTQGEIDRGPRMEWKDPISFTGHKPPFTVMWRGWLDRPTTHKGNRAHSGSEVTPAE